MNPMLKKFKEWYDKNFASRDLEREDTFDIKNHRVMIRDTEYFIAKAMFADIPEMLAIERAVYAGKTPWDSHAFASELKRPKDRLYLVVRKEDRLLAFIGCSFDQHREDAHVTNIAVVPDFQNRGLGYFLMTKMITKSRKLGYQKLTLEVRLSNTQAQALYSDLGFEQVGIKKGYYMGDHEDAVDMRMDLSVPGNLHDD